MHSRNTSNLSFHKTYSVSFDNNRTVQSTTRIYFVLILKKFITKTKFRQQNVFIPLAFHIKCANNFNNSKTQHQAKNIGLYIFKRGNQINKVVSYTKIQRKIENFNINEHLLKETSINPSSFFEELFK